MLFTEHPLLQRPAAAADAGFDAVEFWWPWPEEPVPSDHDVDAFVAAVRHSGVTLTGLNFFAGDLAGPDCGVLSVPGRADDFQENIPVVMAIGAELGVRGFNALFGNRTDGASGEAQDELGVEMLTAAAEAARSLDATVLVEPVSGPKPYPLRTAADVIKIIEQVADDLSGNIGFLCDLFHLKNNGEDLDSVITANADRVAHVQIADWPGRGQPGSGDVDLDHHLTRLETLGYDGLVALEYTPTESTDDSLSWLPRARRAAAQTNR